ncbi:MAG: VOC family protein [Steroidobacteraceae bacterium]|jgi:catechol 2,3-dioxygenase-like lactoylglutathione lyase family enzyme
MFSHVMIGTNDLERARTFYDGVLATLGVPPARMDGHRMFYFTPAGIFSVTTPINGQPATAGNGATIGFAANSPEQVDAWHAAGLAAGGSSCEDPPGVREISVGRLYLAYLRDPDGNKLCALHRL